VGPRFRDSHRSSAEAEDPVQELHLRVCSTAPPTTTPMPTPTASRKNKPGANRSSQRQERSLLPAAASSCTAAIAAGAGRRQSWGPDAESGSATAPVAHQSAEAEIW